MRTPSLFTRLDKCANSSYPRCASCVIQQVNVGGFLVFSKSQKNICMHADKWCVCVCARACAHTHFTQKRPSSLDSAPSTQKPWKASFLPTYQTLELQIKDEFLPFMLYGKESHLHRPLECKALQYSMIFRTPDIKSGRQRRLPRGQM